MDVLGMSSDGSAFLLSEDADTVRILDRTNGRLSEAFPAELAVTHGPWEPFGGDPEPILALARRSSTG
jgi:hypothetical protein